MIRKNCYQQERLSGAAFSYWQSLSNKITNDYEQTRNSLSAVFGRTHYLATFQTYLNACPRKPNVPIEVYAAEVGSLVDEAFPTYGPEAKKCEVFRRFVADQDSALQLNVHGH